MAIRLQENIRIDTIENDTTIKNGVSLKMLRLDEIHPVVSGNKWFKLKYNIEKAIEDGYKSIVTFGGAYSNHLIATAAAAKAFGLDSIGIVRGLHAQKNKTDTLHACENMGMQLYFIDRAEYDKKEVSGFLESIDFPFLNSFLIPEGGNNEAGRRGTAEIASFLEPGFTHVALPVGTAATFTGIRNALDSKVQLLGFAAMKGGEYLMDSINDNLQVKGDNVAIISKYHFGGFAKCNDVLIDFMNSFYGQHRIPLDRVYNAKMMFGIMDMIKEGAIARNSNILCIHTGGLQGNQSIKDKICFGGF